MNDIRKIAVGPDYKSGSMHYLVGQEVLGGQYEIHHIHRDDNGATKIWVKDKENLVFLWKEFSQTMPISIEYNINFE